MAQARMTMTEMQTLTSMFTDALRSRDFERLATAFHPHVHSRLLIPRGLVTPPQRDGLLGRFRQWFGDADHFDIEFSDTRFVGPCLHIGYHIRLREHGHWYRVEQQTYSHLELGRIDRFDLLCSGFQPDLAVAG